MGGEGLTAGAVARRLGVAVTTLRTWHQRYGLGPSHHLPGQHRRYTPEDMSRLQVMRRLTAQGVAPAEAAAWARRAPIATGTPPDTSAHDQRPIGDSTRDRRPTDVSSQERPPTGLPAGGRPPGEPGTAGPNPTAAGPRPGESEPGVPGPSAPGPSAPGPSAPGPSAPGPSAPGPDRQGPGVPGPDGSGPGGSGPGGLESGGAGRDGSGPGGSWSGESGPEGWGPDGPRPGASDRPTFTRLGAPPPGSLPPIDMAWSEPTGRHFTARDGGWHTLHTSRAGPAARGLARAAMRLDGPALRDILELAVVDRGVIAAWDEVILPVLVGVGERYAATERYIEVEHLISRGVTEVLAAVTRPPSAHLPRVLLAAADEEQHTLPLEALAAALAQAGVSSRFLGGRVPPRALSDAVARTGPAAVVLWSQMPSTGAPAQWTHLLSGTHRPLLAAAAGPGWSGTKLPDDVTTVSSLAEAVQLVSMAVLPADQAN